MAPLEGQTTRPPFIIYINGGDMCKTFPTDASWVSVLFAWLISFCLTSTCLCVESEWIRNYFAITESHTLAMNSAKLRQFRRVTETRLGFQSQRNSLMAQLISSCSAKLCTQTSCFGHFTSSPSENVSRLLVYVHQTAAPHDESSSW